MKRLYMNAKTGSIGEYEDWYYDDETGKTVNAVDLHEVVEVIRQNDEWKEVTC